MFLVRRARALGSQFWDVLLRGAVALFVVGGLVGGAHAQTIENIVSSVPYNQVNPNPEDCGLRKIDVDAFVSHRRPLPKDAARTATIEVNYGPGFTTEARQAFERAASIWEAHIESDVTIRIQASFDDLGEGVLGQAGPLRVYGSDTTGNQAPDVYFGSALADAITGEDLQPDEPDISAQFNRERDDWHFGEEDAPSGTLDFTSIVLHEIGHGLNYFGFTGVSNDGTGDYGIDFESQSDVPGIYTLLLAKQEVDGSLISITNESEFPVPSPELGDVLTSGQLFFNSSRARIAAERSTGPIPPKIFAPSNYQEGSSVSHLDEETYPFEGQNALMTPRTNTAETNRLPGPIVCGQLSDMGWSLGSECLRYFEQITDLRFAEDTDPSSGSVTIAWTERGDAGIQSYRVERSYFDGEFEEVEANIQRDGDSFTATVDSLGLGTFAFRIAWTNDDGTEGGSGQELNTTVNLQGPTANVSKDESGRGTVGLSWSVPPGTDSSPRNFTYRVERVTGIGDDFRSLGTTSQRQFKAERQTPGQYQYRVVSEDGQGNTLASTKTSVEISFEGAVFIAGPTPNPVQDQASVELTAKDPQEVSIGIYNTVGERVYFEERDLKLQTPTRLVFDSNRWASGMYFLHLKGEEFTKTRKMVVVH